MYSSAACFCSADIEDPSIPDFADSTFACVVEGGKGEVSPSSVFTHPALNAKAMPKKSPKYFIVKPLSHKKGPARRSRSPVEPRS